MSMFTDVPKLPPQAEYVIERSFLQAVNKDTARNDYSKTGPDGPDQPDLGGYPVSLAGTASTGASGPTISGLQPTHHLFLVPREGPIAYVEMDLQQFAKNSEIIVNPVKNI